MQQTITPEICAAKIRNAKNIAVLTGAGISTAAGIPDFRSPTGIYNSGRYNADVVFDINYFYRDPSEFYRFTRDLLAIVDTLSPTFTHRFLADMERAGMLSAVVTQNIDPLHYTAGSKNVIPIHGNYNTSHCLECGREYSLADLERMLGEMDIPRCDCNKRGIIKPDVVFFGEAVNRIFDAQRAARESDLFFVLGSSLVVYPAAMLPHIAGGEVVIVNRGPVAFEPADGRYFVDGDLDGFFRKVAEFIKL
ncbi:MAG TPA: Sir2 family NAD-dependent protein deacetylase [Phycisphaerae bacterium]|nr:Sir2 family NAD-dependent protein deacetylase [Phycisphaerae bacterium]HPS52054.1 Sir2 family NAD-dependent protein deacetylase [Phycisphaerae bacterium]